MLYLADFKRTTKWGYNDVIHQTVYLSFFQPRLFFRLCDELVKEGAAAGVLTGGRSTAASKATYVPHVYAKAQSDWVDSFYAQNGYLEYDALRRLGRFKKSVKVNKIERGRTISFQ